MKDCVCMYVNCLRNDESNVVVWINSRMNFRPFLLRGGGFSICMQRFEYSSIFIIGKTFLNYCGIFNVDLVVIENSVLL